MSKKDLPCATCGIQMWRSRTSLPAGQARCLPCRRAARRVCCVVCGIEFRSRDGAVHCSRSCLTATQRRQALEQREADECERTRWTTFTRAATIVAIGAGGYVDRLVRVSCRDTGEMLVECQTCLVDEQYVDYETGELIEYTRVAKHPIMLDDRMTGRCDASSPVAQYVLLVGPEQWRRGLGPAPRPAVFRVEHACAVCGTPTTRRRYCSTACQAERNRQVARERYWTAHPTARRYNAAYRRRAA